jgi:hypothetical protein
VVLRQSFAGRQLRDALVDLYVHRSKKSLIKISGFEGLKVVFIGIVFVHIPWVEQHLGVIRVESAPDERMDDSLVDRARLRGRFGQRNSSLLLLQVPDDQYMPEARARSVAACLSTIVDLMELLVEVRLLRLLVL